MLKYLDGVDFTTLDGWVSVIAVLFFVGMLWVSWKYGISEEECEVPLPLSSKAPAKALASWQAVMLPDAQTLMEGYDEWMRFHHINLIFLAYLLGSEYGCDGFKVVDEKLDSMARIHGMCDEERERYRGLMHRHMWIPFMMDGDEMPTKFKVVA